MANLILLATSEYLIVAFITELAVVGFTQTASNGHNAAKVIVMVVDMDNFTPCLYLSYRKQNTSMLLMHFDDILRIQNLLKLIVLFYTTCGLGIYIGFGTQCHGSFMLKAFFRLSYQMPGFLPFFVF